MTERWLTEAVAACGLPSPAVFPRDLAAELEPALSVTLVPLPHLTSDGVREWLERRGRRNRVADRHRRLHGCLVAQGGKGALFYDSKDPEPEQRFTLAHEVAHFVLDHLLPRERALRIFGEAIRPVLDGSRGPRDEERLSAALHQVPLGVQIKLMERGPSGAICAGKVATAEQRADRLALELLAPRAEVLALLKQPGGDDAEARVAARFGVPEEVVGGYVRTLLRRESASGFSILDFLGEHRR